MGRFAKPWILFGVLAMFAASLWVASEPVGSRLGQQFASVILRAGKGKISNPPLFVENRLKEAALLLEWAVLLVAGYRLARSRVAGSQSWAPLAVLAFAALNFWLAAAMHTCLFWAALYTGGATSNYTQFQFKKLLLAEHRAHRQVILVGSSQTQAQIDENILNQELGREIWTTELHFPGSHPLDMLLVLRRLRGQPGDDLVCYLSEYYFYSGVFSTTPPYFLAFSDLLLLRRLGWGRLAATQPFVAGLLGRALPLFACREPLAHRLLGIAINTLQQREHDVDLATNLVRRAEEAAERFKLDASTELQKAAFEEFLREAARQKRRVVLLEGQVNPLLGQRISPEIREDMRRYLRRVKDVFPNVVLVPEKELPSQNPDAYKDLTHVNREAQERFSQWLASWLGRQPWPRWATVEPGGVDRMPALSTSP